MELTHELTHVNKEDIANYLVKTCVITCTCTVVKITYHMYIKHIPYMYGAVRVHMG